MPQRHSSEDVNWNTSCSLSTCNDSRSQWLRALRGASAAAGLLGLRVRIPPNAWMSWVSLLPGRGLCGGLITRPEDAYRLWRLVVCDIATSRMRRHWPALVSPVMLDLLSWKSRRRVKQRRTDNFPRERSTTRETQNPTCLQRSSNRWLVNLWTVSRNNVVRNEGILRLYLVHYLAVCIQVCNSRTLRTVDRPLGRLTGPFWK